MPDADGWEIPSARHVPLILHHECDRRVTNTPAARAAHLRECRADQARERSRLEREAARAKAAEKRRVEQLRREAERYTA